jgi:DedD protein
MDRRVKERLIGASILVALIVLVVPELLSGPKPAAAPIFGPQAITPEPIRNVTVDLATSKAPASSDAEPAAIAASAVGAGPAAEVAAPAAPAATLPAGVPLESPAQSPISAAHAWAVQLGSFVSRANAENLVHQLKGQGLSVYMSPSGSGQSLRYRVRIGPLADREAAERTVAKVKALGHVSTIMAPGS